MRILSVENFRPRDFTVYSSSSILVFAFFVSFLHLTRLFFLEGIASFAPYCLVREVFRPQIFVSHRLDGNRKE